MPGLRIGVSSVNSAHSVIEESSGLRSLPLSFRECQSTSCLSVGSSISISFQEFTTVREYLGRQVSEFRREIEEIDRLRYEYPIFKSAEKFAKLYLKAMKLMRRLERFGRVTKHLTREMGPKPIVLCDEIVRPLRQNHAISKSRHLSDLTDSTSRRGALWRTYSRLIDFSVFCLYPVELRFRLRNDSQTTDAASMNVQPPAEPHASTFPSSASAITTEYSSRAAQLYAEALNEVLMRVNRNLSETESCGSDDSELDAAD